MTIGEFVDYLNANADLKLHADAQAIAALLEDAQQFYVENR